MLDELFNILQMGYQVPLELITETTEEVTSGELQALFEGI